jgi:Zn finger protein HypA/HybF involved in hydrogenase expression
VADHVPGLFECGVCHRPIATSWLRWYCPRCRFVMHYACVTGGVPVAHRPACPDCGGDEMVHAYSDDEQAIKDPEASGRLF